MTDPSPHEILHPKHWKAAQGPADGVAATGRMVFTGGVLGWNADRVFETDDLGRQVARALRSIVEILAEAGAGPQHLVRLTWYVTDREAYLSASDEIGDAVAQILGAHRPAMALVQVVALAEDRAKVEIEATAVIPEPPPVTTGVIAATDHAEAANTDAANSEAGVVASLAPASGTGPGGA